MTISNTFMNVIILSLSFVTHMIVTKIWMNIANFIGEKLGIGDFIIKLINRKK